MFFIDHAHTGWYPPKLSPCYFYNDAGIVVESHESHPSFGARLSHRPCFRTEKAFFNTYRTQREPSFEGMVCIRFPKGVYSESNQDGI